MKNFTKIILTAALAAFFTGQLSAQASSTKTPDNQTKEQTTSQAQAFGKFTDSNNDGVCDNRETKKGNGVKGANFVDANGDGVCDHRGEGNRGNGNQNCRRGQGNGCGKGMGCQQKGGNRNQ